MCFTVNVTTPLSKTAVARWRLYIFPPPNVNHIQLFILKQCHGDGVAASLLLSSNQTICLIADQGLRIAIERLLLCVVVFRAKEAT